jgi:hypothetical protein
MVEVVDGKVNIYYTDSKKAKVCLVSMGARYIHVLSYCILSHPMAARRGTTRGTCSFLKHHHTRDARLLSLKPGFPMN